MLSRVFAWVGVLSTLVGGAGCGSSSGPGQVPEEEFVERVAAVYCHSWAVCCDEADHRFDTEGCVARVSAREGWPTSTSILKYDPSAAGKCLEQVAGSAQCGSFRGDGPCEDVWRGNVAVGKRCSSSLECARSVFEDVRCVGNLCVSAPRAPRGSKGEPCSASCFSGEDCSRSADFTSDGTTALAVCYADDGLYCQASGCAEQLGLGAPCSRDDACRGAAYCDHSSGTCRGREADGAVCRSDRQCRSGHCAFADAVGAGSCRPAGEPSAYECSFGADDLGSP